MVITFYTYDCKNTKFAGPLAHGVLDPLIIPYQMLRCPVPVPVLNPLDLL